MLKCSEKQVFTVADSTVKYEIILFKNYAALYWCESLWRYVQI
jgi:hypothetical protein